MINVVRTYDADLIRSAICEPSVYAAISEDYWPPIDEFEVVTHPSIIYLAVYDGEAFGGVFVVTRAGAIHGVCHSRMLPSFKGPRVVEASKLALQWLFDHHFYRVTCEIPHYNSHAIQLALRAGFTIYGVNHHAWFKDGKFHDLVCLGVSGG
jgi:hypothetical protein